MHVDLSEVHALAHDIDRYADTVEPKAELIIAKTANDVVATGQALSPVDIGFLRSTIGADVDGLSFEAGPTAEYGGYVEEGTDGPYPIPNAFGWGITVMHPGISPSPYMGPAFDRHEPAAIAAFTQLGGQVLG